MRSLSSRLHLLALRAGDIARVQAGRPLAQVRPAVAVGAAVVLVEEPLELLDGVDHDVELLLPHLELGVQVLLDRGQALDLGADLLELLARRVTVGVLANDLEVEK